YNASLTIINSTFDNNSAGYLGGGALYGTGSSISIFNSIFWADFAPSNYEFDLSGGSALVLFSDIQGGYAGPADINSDPLFVNPLAGNYQLQGGSPCINVGDNVFLPPGITTDLAGNPRIDGGTVDMGAYEY
ncbi:MAG TPA: choice-of-anchor Q domain-containing protein, partial [Tepidisphaeraceae bacterium]